MAPQVLEKARFAEENGSRREADTDVRIFLELRKNEVKRLKSLSRAELHTGVKTVDRRTIPPGSPRSGSLLRPLTYMVKPLQGLTDPERLRPFRSPQRSRRMKEPRKTPPRKSRAEAEEKLDEELEESFPASDPPANTPTSVGGPARTKRPAPAKPRRRG